MSFKKPYALLLIAGLAAFAPFVHRALFVDDHAHFSQAIDWGAGSEPLYKMASGLGWQAGQAPGEANPVLYFLYYGAFTHTFGAEEWKAHVAMWPWNFLALFSFFVLARRFTKHAVFAALLWLFTPHFWLTANSLLVDALVAPLLLASLAAWITGWDRRSSAWLVTAGILLGLVPLAKYTGLAAWPVAALWSVRYTKTWKDKRWGFGVIPVFIFAGWLVFTQVMYGQTHFWAVAGDRMAKPGFWHFVSIILFILGTTPALWSAMLSRLGGRTQKPSADHFLWGWVFISVVVLWVAIPWICARYLVIVGPALVLLSVRLIENSRWGQIPTFRTGVLIVTCGFGFLMAHADYSQADVDRQIARRVKEEKGTYPAAALSGLGFYLDSIRWRPAGPGETVQGDLLLPMRTLAPRFWPRPSGPIYEKRRWEYGTWNPLRVLDSRTGAGFYGSIWGPFPFTISKGPLETYVLVGQ